MARGVTVLVLLALAQAHVGGALDPLENLGDATVDKLFGRELKSSPYHRADLDADLDSTSLGKASSLAMGQRASATMAMPSARMAAPMLKSQTCAPRQYWGCTVPNPGGALADQMFAKLGGARDVSVFAKVGDKFPDVSIDQGFPPTKVNLAERLKGKKTIFVGLPGAFTPVCSNNQVPGYLAKQDELKAKGVDEVLIYCVNDGAVMEGWARDQKIAGSMITFLADTQGEVTKALDMVLDAPGVIEKLGNPRCERFSMVVDDGVIKAIAVAGRPTPDEATFAEAMLKEC